MSAPLPLQDDEGWRDDNALKCHDLALGVLREELVISRKALREIAEPVIRGSSKSWNGLFGELNERRYIAIAALEAIEKARAGNG